VALPSEHGGWSLTLEPVLLGLLVEPSSSGALLGVAALLVFLVRTPLKLAFGDRRRGRRLARTVAAERAAALYLIALAGVVAGSIVTARAAFWLPLAVATPLVAVAFAYDVRSLSRRLVPELLGTIGIGSAAAAIVLAGGGSGGVAAGMWLVAGARAVSAVLYVRVQLRRAKHQAWQRWHTDLAQGVAMVTLIVGSIGGIVPVAGLVALAVVSVVHVVLSRRPPARAAMIGAQQVVFGLTVVLATGLGAIAP
jgi:hypothetical protein